MNKKIVVTGSSGFIGYNLSHKLLQDGNEVIGIDSLNNAYDIHFKELRLNNLKKFKNFTQLNLKLYEEKNYSVFKNYLKDVDTIFHLAARAGVRQSFIEPKPYVFDNTLSTLLIANLAKDAEIKKLILASTSSIYGNSGNQMMEENKDEKIEPPSIYASTKLAGEVLAKNLLEGSRTNLIITRFFTVYGPYGRPDMSILRFIHWILEGFPVILYGDGKQSRSFTYVDDVVELLELTLDINKSLTLNVGSNKTTKLIEIINLIESITEKKAKIDFQERAYKDPDVVLPNLNLVKEVINWSPKTTIEIGLEKTVKWYLKHRDEIKNLRYL